MTSSIADIVFAIASDGTAMCNNKAFFTYNLMHQAINIADIDKGEYDTRLEELVLLTRGIYCIEQLNSIANIYMKQYPRKDEIEVYHGL